MNTEFAIKLGELRARKDRTTLEQEALDTEDPEVLARLCPQEITPPKET